MATSRRSIPGDGVISRFSPANLPIASIASGRKPRAGESISRGVLSQPA